MGKILFALAFIAMLAWLAAAQDSRVTPPLTARENTQAASAQPNGKQMSSSSSSKPPFCPPKTCLYYAGDFDSGWSGADGSLNGNFDGGSVFAQTQVGIKPPRAVTGATLTSSSPPAS
jgi:hypothetical protein